MEPSEPNEKGDEKRESLLRIFLRKLKLRHLVFLIAAVICLAITATVIVVLLRISTLRITDMSSDTLISGNDYLGIIGVLVALAAAFIGALATIMFGNSVYSTYISKRAEEKVRRHEKYIPDLYVLALRIEANECERDGNILRAIERRIGVIYFALKSSYSLSTSTINYFLDDLKDTVDKLTIQNLKNYYSKPAFEKNKKKIKEDIEDYQSEIDRRIKGVTVLDKAFLADTKLAKMKKYIVQKIVEYLEQLESKEKYECI